MRQGQNDVLIRLEIKPVSDGWEIQLLDRDGVAVLDPRTDQAAVRKLLRAGPGGFGFPLPPAEEAGDLAAGVLHRSLCLAENDAERTALAASLNEIYCRLVDRAPSSDARDMERFGGYLFATLLGDVWWKLVRNKAGRNALELALLCTADDRGFLRLPWEMMHIGDGFLAQEKAPPVSITPHGDRRCRRGGSPDVAAALLFVVGGDLGDDLLPGAEFVGVVRSLDDQEIPVLTHLLLQASVTKLRIAMAAFQPTVVHFICHGGVTRAGAGYLDLYDEETSKPKPLLGPGLRELLCPDPNKRPEVVVLNACYTAERPSNSLATLGRWRLRLPSSW